MLNCLIWGTGKVFTNELQSIRYLEMTNQIRICGVTSNVTFFSTIAGYPFVTKESITVDQYDVVFIMADGKIFNEIRDEAIKMGFCRDILVHHRVIHVINNNLEKYMEIKKRNITIFSNNCWGGFAYHTLGLEFYSPLINMAVSELDYLKFLKEPKRYLDSDLEYIGNHEGKDVSFPLARCDDIILRFFHYESFDDAKRTWEKRKKRINWNCIFAMFCTENIDFMKEFGRLDYENKICFSPFDTDIANCIHIDFYRENMQQHNCFGSLVACLASEQYQYIDLIDLFYGGTITKISKESSEAKYK